MVGLRKAQLGSAVGGRQHAQNRLAHRASHSVSLVRIGVLLSTTAFALRKLRSGITDRIAGGSKFIAGAHDR